MGNNMILKVFLDDIRTPPDDTWVIVRTVEQAKQLLKDNVVAVLSLDHDLGESEPTGYDLVCWIEEQVFKRKLLSPVMKIHSANPVGRKNMEAGIQSIIRMSTRQTDVL